MKALRESLLLILSVNYGCGGASPATPSPVQTQPPQKPPLSSLVDTYSFIKPWYANADRELVASAAYYTRGNLLYQFSWYAQNPQAYVVLSLEGDAVFLMEDRTWGHSAGKWYRLPAGGHLMNRWMKVGDVVSDNAVQEIYSLNECSHLATRVYPIIVTMVEHAYLDVGGDLGEIEVIGFEIHSEGYRYGKTLDGKGLGLIGWHDRTPAAPWTYTNKWHTISPVVPSLDLCT